MEGSTKKFVLGLFGMVVLVFLLLISQIKKSLLVTTHQSADPLIAFASTDIPLGNNEPLLGNPGATFTIVGYLDLGSYGDRQLYAQISAAVRAHPRDLRFFIKPAPYASWLFNSSHTATHLALACATEQNHQWEYADQLALITTLWRQQQLDAAARAASLNQTSFAKCLTSASAKSNLQSAIAAAQIIAPNPPTIFVNNKKISLTKDVDLPKLLDSFIAP